MRIAFLHLSPIPGDLSGNRECIRHGVITAADKGARWVLTPELATCGYTFAKSLGLDWIEPAPDPWSAEIGGIAAQRGVTVFLATPERDVETGVLYNALLVFDGAHGLVGSRRKVNPLRVGSEAWSSPGTAATVLPIDDFGPVGLLICADACSIDLAVEMKRRGAQTLVSSCELVAGTARTVGRMGGRHDTHGIAAVRLQSNRTGRRLVVRVLGECRGRGRPSAAIVCVARSLPDPCRLGFFRGPSRPLERGTTRAASII